MQKNLLYKTHAITILEVLLSCIPKIKHIKAIEAH